ncbi:MAG: hypothetical protein Q4E03_06025 [Trueperella sp.]|nr:hypothetical protein [Trueperella sp.]
MTKTRHAVHPTPTGEVQHIGVNDLFFSTTDWRGVIEDSNNVFTRLSRYSAAELRGAPHNIIRHPMMPAGAFHSMWEWIQNGKPFGAYVHNLAQDGSRYDVFATIVPKRGGGYLSVRIPPVVPEFFKLTDDIYAQALQLEAELRESGLSRREAAARGADKITELIQEAGFLDYDDYMHAVFTSEVLARAAIATEIPTRPTATGPVAHKLQLTEKIYQELNNWMGRLSELQAMSESLSEADKAIRNEISRAAVPDSINSQISGEEHHDVRVMVDVLKLTQQATSDYLANLHETFTNLYSTISAARFRIALAHVHATMLAIFLVEVIDYDTSADSEIQMLIEALEDGVTDMEYATHKLIHQTINAGAQTKAALHMMQLPTQMAKKVEQQTEGMTLDAGGVMDIAASAIEQLTRAMERMQNLSQRCEDLCDFDPTRLRELLHTLN